MEIELLFFEDCPSWKEGLENLNTALKLEGITASIVLIRVEDNQTAERQRFLGSPSFRINGQDVWKEERTNYSLSCRVYQTTEGLRGSPSVEMLQNALKEFNHT